MTRAYDNKNSILRTSALLLLVFPLSSVAQTHWLGVPVPPGMGDPHLPSVDVGMAHPAPAHFPADEANYVDLKGENIYPLVRDIVEFSYRSRDEGNRVWGRITGFPSHKATEEWVAEQFREAGLSDVEVQEYSGTGEFWWPNEWEVRMLGDERFGEGTQDVVLETSLVTAGSEIAGGSLTAGVIDAGYITDEIPDTDITGKIAVQSLRPVTGAYTDRTPTRERAQRLMAKGAVGVINVVEQIGNMHTRDFSNCNGACFNVGTADGDFLKSFIGAAADRGLADAVKMRLSVAAENLTGLKGHNTVGIVRGKGSHSNESIIVNAHADGWYDAAGDNGDGLAVVIAMARHFARPENVPDRTLIFVASGGHHSPGLNGPQNLVAMNPALLASAVLVYNLEHVAQFEIDSSNWKVGPREQPMNLSITNSSPYLAGLMKSGIERYGFNLRPDFRVDAPGDLGGYRSLGVPMIQAIHSGPMYHASGDVLTTISVPGLERAARFFTFLVTETANADANEIDP